MWKCEKLNIHLQESGSFFVFFVVVDPVDHTFFLDVLLDWSIEEIDSSGRIVSGEDPFE